MKTVNFTPSELEELKTFYSHQLEHVQNRLSNIQGILEKIDHKAVSKTEVVEIEHKEVVKPVEAPIVNKVVAIAPIAKPAVKKLASRKRSSRSRRKAIVNVVAKAPVVQAPVVAAPIAKAIIVKQPVVVKPIAKAVIAKSVVKTVAAKPIAKKAVIVKPIAKKIIKSVAKAVPVKIATPAKKVEVKAKPIIVAKSSSSAKTPKPSNKEFTDFIFKSFKDSKTPQLASTMIDSAVKEFKFSTKDRGIARLSIARMLSYYHKIIGTPRLGYYLPKGQTKGGYYGLVEWFSGANKLKPAFEKAIK